MISRKSKVIFLFVVVTSLIFSLTFINVIQAEQSKITRIQQLKNRIIEKRSQNFWGPIFLDPGDGGGGGGVYPDPTLFDKTLLLFNPYPEQGDLQSNPTADIFSDWLWHVNYVEDCNKATFLNSIQDADDATITKLALHYVGHCTLVGGDPVLEMPDGSYVCYENLEALSRTKTNWHLKLVLMSACYSLDNTVLADGFNKLGAQVVIGGEGDVNMETAASAADLFNYYLLTEHCSVEEAFEFAKDSFNDGVRDADELKTEVWTNVFDSSEETLLDGYDTDYYGTIENVRNYLVETYGQTWGIVVQLLAILLILILVFGILAIPLFNGIQSKFPYKIIDYDTSVDTYI